MKTKLLLMSCLMYFVAACQDKTVIIRESAPNSATQKQEKELPPPSSPEDAAGETEQTDGAETPDKEPIDVSVDPTTGGPGKPKKDGPSRGLPSSKPNGKANGGTASGGDNGVQGRNIEDYATNIQKEANYIQFVLPIITKLAETHPRFASDMIHIANERTWYMVPVELEALKASQIGLKFADQSVQQFALQNLRAIWINTKFYNAFESAESKGRLILHEILMGVRLMKLKSEIDNCYSSIAIMKLDPKKTKEYQQAREQCARTYIFGRKDAFAVVPGQNPDLELTSHDYDGIRELGVHLWERKGEISGAELDAWIKVNDFRSY
ncbi:hypothetical protein ACLVWU_01765 [Bdellovibrio sp. HCB290]|uniref:hypothetical protein n=1 Tax=Bdellovibrio sp. HCB290 TaxID=3394356 RepID=UPI0039B39C7F